MQPSMTVSTAFQMASGSCSTHPGCGKAISMGTEALATIFASRSMMIALVFDVPWSTARRKSLGMDSYSGHQQTKPPSTMRSMPVQKEAAWLERNTAGPTISSTVAMRPRGVSASNCFTCSATSGRKFIGVAV